MKMNRFVRLLPAPLIALFSATALTLRDSKPQDDRDLRGKRPSLDEIARACSSGNPYFAVTYFPNNSDGDKGSVVMLQDDTTHSEDGKDGPAAPWPLVLSKESGTVHGLAYDHVRSQLYTSRFHMNGPSFGQDDLGSIYRLDMKSGAVLKVISLDAGTNPHPGHRIDFTGLSKEFIHAIGRIGIGDIDVDEEATSLYVMNLFDGMIYVFGLPDLAFRERYSATVPPEGSDAEILPFAIGVRNGYVYTGAVVIPTLEDARVPMYIELYRRDQNGSPMRRIARANLDYSRQTRWSRWLDKQIVDPVLESDPAGFVRMTEPVFTDIEFSDEGMPIVGLSNRRQWIVDPWTYGGGNVLKTTLDHSGQLEIVTNSESYQDHFRRGRDLLEEDVLHGTLARMPRGNHVIATTYLSR